MELFQKSSIKYTPCAQGSPRVTPYSGPGQLMEDVQDDCSISQPLPPDNRILQTTKLSLNISNQTDETEPPLSHRSTSSWTSMNDHVIDMEPHYDVTMQSGPEYLITCRRKTTYEARVRLKPDSNPVYVGRYKCEQAARDACSRLLRQATPPRKTRK